MWDFPTRGPQTPPSTNCSPLLHLLRIGESLLSIRVSELAPERRDATGRARSRLNVKFACRSRRHVQQEYRQEVSWPCGQHPQPKPDSHRRRHAPRGEERRPYRLRLRGRSSISTGVASRLAAARPSCRIVCRGLPSLSRETSRSHHSASGNLTLIEHWNGKAWEVKPSPNPARSGEVHLTGVAATSRSNAWAVGYYLGPNGLQPLVEHWNGKAWKIKRTPKPGGQDNLLFGMAAVSASNVWAVGDYYDGSHARTLTMRCG